MASAGSSERGPRSSGRSPAGPEPEPTPGDAQCDQVISAWNNIRGLLERAGKGRIIRVPFNGLDRQAVIDNADILEPVILAYGCWPALICEVIVYSYRLEPTP